VGIQQLFYADYVLMIFPPWPNRFPGYSILACLFSASLFGAGLAIIMEKNARRISLLLGIVLLVMLLLGQVPFEYIVVPYKKTHLGVWVNALKELALAGGAFAVAGSLLEGKRDAQTTSVFFRFLEKLIPLGRIFFSITMISFGIAHFLYLDSVATLVPYWISGHIFWTYFTGVALIAAGLAIIMKIWLQMTAILLGAMILIWFIFLHIPRAIAYPVVAQGNEITSALSALAFSGIAFVIAGAQNQMKEE
jgi:hypothetical protein